MNRIGGRTFSLAKIKGSVLNGSRRGDGDDDGAGQADLAFADEEHGLVLARFGFARRQQGAVVHIGGVVPPSG